MNQIETLAQQAANAISEKDVVELTQQLVQIRSVYEPGKSSEQAAAEFIATLLRGKGLKPVVEEVSPGRPNIICDWSGTTFNASKHKTLMFEGHTDVVTEGDASAWTHPPFEARIVDGKLYGRGSADMKAGVAAAICALEAIRKVAPDLPGRIRLGLVSDEEGMMTGIKHFIGQGHANEVDGAIICEPEENEICLFQKGAMRVNVTFTGVMSHGAMPYAGVNPIAALSVFIEKVKEVQQREQNRLGSHEFLGLPWFTPTIIKSPISGEAQHNVMPESAYLALDIRTVPGQDHDEILKWLHEIAQTLEKTTPRLKINVDCFESRPWTQTHKDNPLVTAVEKAYPAIFNEPPKYGGVPGATDGTFLHAWAKVPIVTIGPGLRTIPHQRDEYVDVADVVQSARLYTAAAIYFLLDS
jgi:succinyl-diaminopimelate desuccinylase